MDVVVIDKVHYSRIKNTHIPFFFTTRTHFTYISLESAKTYIGHCVSVWRLITKLLIPSVLGECGQPGVSLGGAGVNCPQKRRDVNLWLHGTFVIEFWTGKRAKSITQERGWLVPLPTLTTRAIPFTPLTPPDAILPDWLLKVFSGVGLSLISPARPFPSLSRLWHVNLTRGARSHF